MASICEDAGLRGVHGADRAGGGSLGVSADPLKDVQSLTDEGLQVVDVRTRLARAAHLPPNGSQVPGQVVDAVPVGLQEASVVREEEASHARLGVD